MPSLAYPRLIEFRAMAIKVTELSEAEPRPRRVAIGTFDGVHVGHRRVIEGADTVLTFDPHPLSVLAPDAAPKLLMPFTAKRDVLDGLGVRELVVIRFNREFSKLSAEQFIEEVLERSREVKKPSRRKTADTSPRLRGYTLTDVRAEHVSVGENFRFGAKAKGDPAMLAARSEFETRVVPLVEVDGETVSSTRIRALVQAGEVEAAMRCLAAPFLYEGVVVEGDKRGRELGFPTANIVPDDRLVVPGHGVYAGFANEHPAAIHIGVRPMFETGRGLLIEPHLIDFEGDLYGRTLRIAFVARLRGEKRFPSVDDLIAQMHRDVEQARRICAEFRGPPAVAS